MVILAVKVTPESVNLQKIRIKSGLISQVLIRATRWRQRCKKEALK